ncbi:LOW QUALITY PROTEIN: uncharacterized protein [Musca autumnalis]|uniref:LOW QUALITY PROTEIN: uncharacterized protein n=1 Tax=Musca autumnalis TaxID=221902 RepID=UPI003CE966F9
MDGGNYDQDDDGVMVFTTTESGFSGRQLLMLRENREKPPQKKVKAFGRVFFVGVFLLFFIFCNKNSGNDLFNVMFRIFNFTAVWAYMKYIILVLLLVSLASARKVKRKGAFVLPPQPQQLPQSPSGLAEPYAFEEVRYEEYANEQPPPQNPHHRQTHYEEAHYEVDPHYAHSPVSTGSSFLVDNGLRSIAKGSADQANSAVVSQNAAAKQAAYIAKSTLAQAAVQAAGTAVAVLKGKEVLLQRLEEQTAEAHKAMQGELQQLQQAKRAAKAAQYSAHQALQHVSVLTAALNNAQAASELAQKSASEAAAELSSQIDMVAQAKAKLEQIESHLYSARLDYEETKEAAEKATHSAQEAQFNANDAGLHANVELSETASASLTVGAHDKSDEEHQHNIVKRGPGDRGREKSPRKNLLQLKTQQQNANNNNRN